MGCMHCSTCPRNDNDLYSRHLLNKITPNQPLTNYHNHHFYQYNGNKVKDYDYIVDITKDIQIDTLEKIYKSNLKPYAVLSMNMKLDDGTIMHHFNYLASTPCKAKTSRINKELKNLTTMLPISLANSIFLRYNESNLDYMKAIITGVRGTPYAHGCFLYDIFIDQYPSYPPKVNLMTTSNGEVRFNPNLYSSGYVCLSLLGTWNGIGCEKWTPNSTIYQILLSIQSLVMSEYVYSNEPGFESRILTPEGKKLNEGYSNIIKYYNIKAAMIDMLKNPPNGFKEAIQCHFYIKKYIILEDCRKWIIHAKETEASYTDLVNSHNAIPCKKLSIGFDKHLEQLVNTLEKELETLKISIKPISTTNHNTSSDLDQDVDNAIVVEEERKIDTEIKKDTSISMKVI